MSCNAILHQLNSLLWLLLLLSIALCISCSSACSKGALDDVNGDDDDIDGAPMIVFDDCSSQRTICGPMPTARDAAITAMLR